MYTLFNTPGLSLGRILLMLLGILSADLAPVLAQESYIATRAKNNYFPLVSTSETAEIYIDNNEYKGVLRAAQDLRSDIERVTGKLPELHTRAEVASEFPVIVGTLGKSRLIENLKNSGKLDVSSLEGAWENFAIQLVNDPFPGIDRALVIVGSDKRGTIFGLYDVSREIGVSPWYFWADVPAKKADQLYVRPGVHSKGSPKVKYRGIFINDEAPALAGWATENFGGFNSEFYEHVFELILRMQGNYLWPAMWGRAFYDDDPKNPVLAHEYGVVIGTSHHEPLMRAHDEWRRFGRGQWNYEINPEGLQEFWKVGMQRMGDFESVVTVGMRGDGDEPMSEGTAIELLERIVSDQREIISQVTGKPAQETPQVWALYKEVQDYYDQGMRVPDDVTLLLADDNWGNLRKLPDPDQAPRAGGYGIYYHFDYVGGPRNYKWINTTQISRVWEQMNLAYQYGADELWIVNVGDIKPMEYPTSFFLDYAWNPQEIGPQDLRSYTQAWSARQLGEEHAQEIADILLTYTKYNSRRKPELISPDTYSLINFNEADRIVKEFRELEEKAEALYRLTSEEYKDAYYQLVLFPVKAAANLNALYVAAAKNRLYADQARAATNKYAREVRELFQRDAELTDQYHTELSDGKWNHMMSQTHIGYTYWQEPEHNNMPQVKELDLPQEAAMGIAVQGTETAFTDGNKATLPGYDPFHDPVYFVEVFNKGQRPFSFEISNRPKWLKVSKEKGQVEDQERLWVSVDWNKAPRGVTTGVFELQGAGSSIEIGVLLNNPQDDKIYGFVESNGYVSMEAASFSKNVKAGEDGWVKIPNLGRTDSAMASFPHKPTQRELTQESPHLMYHFHTFNSGQVELEFLLSPGLDFRNQGGLGFAISIDNQKPKVLNIHQLTKDDWDTSVANNVTSLRTSLDLPSGNHSLKVWALETGVVLQKIVIRTGEEKPSYLGPPQSARVK